MSHSYSFYLFIFAVALVPFVIGQELTVGTPLTNQSLQANATTQYSFSVPSYCNNIIIQVNQTNTFAQGDPDLYISTIQNWPQYGKAWISDAYGSDFRVIPFDDVDYVTGTYYLNVVNYCDPVNVSCAPITFDILILLEETTNPENTQEITIDADGVYNQSICIPNNCTIFRITAVALDDIGDPDLYASNTVSNPNIYKNYLWVSAVNGSSQPEYLSVSNADPEYTAGAYYIVLHNFCSTGNDCGNSTFNLTVETFQAETCPPVIASEGNNGTDLTSGQPLINLTLVSQTYSDPYRIFVPDICQDLHVEVTQTNTPGNGDPDLYISKLNLYPTYGKAWSSVATGSENFTLSHADPDYQSGWFYLYTYNYCDNKTISCANITYDLVASVLPLNESIHNSNQPSLVLASQNVYNATICASSGSPGICVKVAPRSGNPFLYATNTNSNVLPTTALWISDSAGPNQTETLFISNQDPQFTLGTYWIAIFNGGENMDANLTISSTLTREECFGPEESTTGTAGTTSGNASGTSGSTSGSSGNQGSTSVPETFTTGKNDHAKESSGNKVTVIGVAVVAIATLIVAIV